MLAVTQVFPATVTGSCDVPGGVVSPLPSTGSDGDVAASGMADASLPALQFFSAEHIAYFQCIHADIQQRADYLISSPRRTLPKSDTP